MVNKKRLFIAIQLNQEAREKMAGLIQKLKQKYYPIRWEKPEKLHITLKFLGWVDLEKIPQIEKVIKETANKYKNFKLKIKGLDFLNHRHFVLILGVESESGILEKMQERVERLMAREGWEREKRKFFPHITIGRGLSGQTKVFWKKTGEELKKKKLPKIPAIIVKRIVLMESKISYKGSKYRVRYAVQLKV